MRAGRLAERPYDVPQRIVIPNLTGMIVPAALRSADDVGFTLASADPMMRLADVASSGRWQVAEQEPVGDPVPRRHGRRHVPAGSPGTRRR